MEKRNDRIFLGLILVLIGVYCILKAIGINLAAFLAGWGWIIIAIIGLYICFFKKKVFSGILITGIGVVFILAERGIISTALPFPIILTLVGLLFLFTSSDKKPKE